MTDFTLSVALGVGKTAAPSSKFKKRSTGEMLTIVLSS
jgi:hypothetical protein